MCDTQGDIANELIVKTCCYVKDLGAEPDGDKSKAA
jgi:hypothetical protein